MLKVTILHLNSHRNTFQPHCTVDRWLRD